MVEVKSERLAGFPVVRAQWRDKEQMVKVGQM